MAFAIPSPPSTFISVRRFEFCIHGSAFCVRRPEFTVSSLVLFIPPFALADKLISPP